MTAVWFLAERRFEHTLSNQAGGCVFSAVLAIDMAVLLLDMLFPGTVWEISWQHPQW